MSDIRNGPEVMLTLAEREGFNDATNWLLSRDGSPSDLYFAPPECGHEGGPHTDANAATRPECRRCRYLVGWMDGVSK